MRWILYASILGLMLMAPVEQLDIAKLEPVEAVAVSMAGKTIILKTDQDSTGRGSSAKEALKDLKESAAAVVYLDTAEYLLVGEGAETAAQELKIYLKRNVQTANYRGGSVQEEAKYLAAHGNGEKPE